MINYIYDIRFVRTFFHAVTSFFMLVGWLDKDDESTICLVKDWNDTSPRDIWIQ